jgi:oxygen-dependent protoporphyrinogen oxidase
MGLSKKESSMKKRIAIIGGGISGLSAAWHAKQLGMDVELFESGPKLGGVLGTIQWDGRLIEGAADNFATLDAEAIRWCRAMGMEEEFIPPEAENRRAMVLFRGKPVPIPGGFSLVQPTRILPVLTTPLLSIAGKARLLWEYFVPARKDQADECLYDFAVRRLGKEAFERLVEPIVGGIFTADPKRLSMQATLPQFVAMEKEHGGLIRGWLAQKRSKGERGKGSKREIEQQASGARYAQFLAPKKGMAWWIDAIESKLTDVRFHLDCPIHSIHRLAKRNSIHSTELNEGSVAAGGEGWTLEIANGSKCDFDGIILATPAFVSARLLSSVTSESSEQLTKFRAASSVVVAMILDRKEIQKMAWCFGIVVPEIENRPVLAISFSSLKYPGRVHQDEILVRIFMGGSLKPELLLLEDRDLLQIAAGELQEVIGFHGQPRWSKVIRWNAAMPQYDVGHPQRVESLEASLAREAPSIRLAGASYKGVGIPQCVRSGRKAAEALAGYFGYQAVV